MLSRRKFLSYSTATAASLFVGMNQSQAKRPVAQTNTAQFKVFDEIILKGKPDIDYLPFSKLHFLTAWELYGENQYYIDNYYKQGLMPPKQAIDYCFKKRCLNGIDPAKVVLDLEDEKWQCYLSWIYYNGTDIEQVNEVNRVTENINRHIQLLNAIKSSEFVPQNTKFSFYNLATVPATRTHLITLLLSSGGPVENCDTACIEQTWNEINSENARLQNLIDQCDFLTPSIYTMPYYEYSNWEKLAEAVLIVANGMAKGKKNQPDKEVIPFIWPQEADQHSFLSGVIWRQELDYLYNNPMATSMLIWCARASNVGDTYYDWDPSAEWWLQTQGFMAQNTFSQETINPLKCSSAWKLLFL